MDSPTPQGIGNLNAFPAFRENYEVRLLIWKAALPGPRLVDIRQRKLKQTIGEWEIKTGQEWPEMLGDLKPQEDTIDRNNPQGGSNFDQGNTQDAWHLDEVTRNRTGMRVEMGKAIGAGEDNFIGYKKANLVGMWSETCAPHILYVCREARDIVLESYSPAFFCTGSFPQTYFNFAIDTLYLQVPCFSYYHSIEGLGSISLDLEYRCRVEDIEKLRKVRNLAIMFDTDVEYSAEVDLASILGIFGGIKKFSIVPAVTDHRRRLNMEKLEEYQRADCDEGKFPWEMPDTNEEVAVSALARKELEI